MEISQKGSAPGLPVEVVRRPATSQPRTGTMMGAAPTRYHQTQLSARPAAVGQQACLYTQTPPPRPSTKFTIALTCSPQRRTARIPSEEPPVPRTIPQMWGELSRRARANVAAEKGTSEPTSPVSRPARLLESTSATPPSTSTPPPPPPASAARGRGRPRGSRRGMSYSSSSMGGGGRSALGQGKSALRQPRQARVNAPPLVWGRRRVGRPPRQPSPSPRELYHRASTHFLAFLCEWSGCRAELHNLDTLRRHVQVVHGGGRGRGRHRHTHGMPSTTCRWGQCRTGGFASAREWHAHLEQEHFVPFQWHVGDGPRNTSGHLPAAAGRLLTTDGPPQGPPQEEPLPDYLMGPDGQQVTPSIRDQELEDFATWKENRRKLKAMLILRDSNLPDPTSESSGESE
ncbi:hypothetical protein E4U41_005602 [Claviceps citrina]|nr:hypothetical protein E4U41_005602 [Claviceps citrina]